MSGTLSSLERIAGPVSRETFARLEAFEALFRKWAARINLTAPSQLDSLWERHILDSAQLLPLGGEALHWVDIGSGGGFPGAVLAILLAERPGATIDLFESNRKKASFLQTVLAGIGSARVHANRVEEDRAAVATPDIITARAVAPLPVLFSLCEPWLAGTARGLFQKGRDYRREVEESRDGWQFDLIERPSLIDADGIILDVSRLRRK